ncbi:adenylyltransferase/cytidyltransferase family protein [Micromonospora sp. C51]|uniref:adenylyltransferase/cytidyltransferase family protein n=1 Tax=Micromonospora sp. C51 TaxID=2824879 RepID=UPI001B37467E|nr:adenylyltransferase/cytidyltransferase family protein [Micromonospora sp. C51]
MTIGLASGVFDLLHVGHMRFLEVASAAVDILLIGVDSNEKVATRKGQGRPILDESERVEMLSHVRHADAIFLKLSSHSRWWLINEVRPDVLFVSSGHYNVCDADAGKLSSLCGRVEVITYQPNFATSQRHRIAGWRGEAK